MSDPTPDPLADLAITLRAERDLWTLATFAWSLSAVLVGSGYVAYVGGLVLQAGDNMLTPVHASPGVGGIAGASHYTKEEATRIAALHGGGYRAVHYRDVPHIRIAEIDEMLGFLGARAEVA